MLNSLGHFYFNGDFLPDSTSNRLFQLGGEKAKGSWLFGNEAERVMGEASPLEENREDH